MEKFQQLYEKYYIQCRNYAYFLTNNTHIAEDVLQDAWLKVYKSYLKDKINTNFKSYVYRTIKNTYIDNCIRKKSSNDISIDIREIELPSLENLEKKVLNQINIENILSQFNGFEKRIIELLLGGYEYKDIADELDINIKKLYKLCYNIKRKVEGFHYE